MSALVLIAGTELRLMTREWAVMVFTFVFPPLLMLILAGVFGTEASPEYGGTTPADYYVADYLAVPLGAVALVGLPVMIASYRERGILRRFEASGVAASTVIAAQALVASILVLTGAAFVLAVAAPTYGVPSVHNPLGVALGFASGTFTMVLLGVSLGLLAATARSAQALGLLAFFPMWLLGAGGPPRSVMPDAMGRVADLLPLGHVASVIRESWLGTGDPGGHLLALVGWLGVAATAVALLERRGRAWTWSSRP